MKVTEHVEHLLRQGRKPNELIELGFPKSVITRVRRQLREEKAAPQTKVPEGTDQTESHPQTLAVSPDQMAVLQRKVQSMADDLERIDILVKALSEVTVLMAAAREFGTYRRETCPYDKDDLCTLETWASENEIPQGIGKPILVENEKPQWYIKPSPFYCVLCSASLEDRLDDVEHKLSDDPLSGASSKITCKHCGSKGLIAVKIMCTKCGRETYLGFWPKKE